MSSYPIVEHFYSIQGEGFHSGVAAYFVRLAGCDVRCPWCDAKESWRAEGHEELSTEQIAEEIKRSGALNVVITGGEPLMHDLGALTDALHKEGLQIFLESSGSRELSGDIDWICISPKRRKPPIPTTLLRASELKVVIESEQDFIWAEECASKVGNSCMLYMQVEWSRKGEVMPLVVEYAKSNPRWMVSIQTHKYMNIP